MEKLKLDHIESLIELNELVFLKELKCSSLCARKTGENEYCDKCELKILLKKCKNELSALKKKTKKSK